MKNNQPVSTEKVYFWNLLGNLAFAGSSVLFTLIVTRMTSPMEADSFSLAYGIAAILVVVGVCSSSKLPRDRLFSLDTPLPVTVLPDVSLSYS